MKDYKVVYSDSFDRLELMINDLASKGWKITHFAITDVRRSVIMSRNVKLRTME